MKARYLDQPWPLRFLAIGILAAAYFGIYRPSEDQQATLTQAAADGLTRTLVAQDALRNAPTYIAQAHAIERELGSAHMSTDESASMASLLIDIDRAAQQRGIIVSGLEPQRTAPNPKGLDLLLRARGHYGDILHYCMDLALVRNVLVFDAIDAVRDSRPTLRGQAPLLNATIRLTLLRELTTAETKGATL